MARTITLRSDKGGALTWQEMDANLSGLDEDLTTVEDTLPDKADLASPDLTGTPTAPTASQGTSTTQVATTEFVVTAVAAGGAGDGDHSALTNLAYASAGHTGFASSSHVHVGGGDGDTTLTKYKTPSFNGATAYCEVVSDSTGVDFVWNGTNTGTFSYPANAILLRATIRIDSGTESVLDFIYDSGADDAGQRFPIVQVYAVTSNQINTAITIKAGQVCREPSRITILGADQGTDLIITMIF